MKVVILDRDGVINNDSEGYIKTADEWIPVDGSVEAIAELHSAGYRVMVATNQSGLGRNLFDEFALAQIHYKLCSMVEEAGGIVDGIFYCPHTPEDLCECRKPDTGLLRQIEEEFECSLVGSYFIGDSYKDIQAADAFGCKPVLVRTGNGIQTEHIIKTQGRENVPVFENLAEAVQKLFFCSDV